MKIQYHVIELHNGKFLLRKTRKLFFWAVSVEYRDARGRYWWPLEFALEYCLFDSEDDAIYSYRLSVLDPVRVTEVSA